MQSAINEALVDLMKYVRLMLMVFVFFYFSFSIMVRVILCFVRISSRFFFISVALSRVLNNGSLYYC